MHTRSWRWLRGRILALLSRPPSYLPVRRQEHVTYVPIYGTRLQKALMPSLEDELDRTG